MKSSKFLASLVSVIMLFGIVPITSAAMGFQDVSTDDLNYDAVSYLQSEKVVEGYGDGTYKPESTINRAEFLKILMLVSDFTPAGANCYKDVRNEWFAPYICAATNVGLVEGYSDGFFRPERDINFAEASKIIVNALKLQTEAVDANVWYKHYVLALDDAFAIPPTILDFDKKITRGEMAEMIYRVDADVNNKVSNTYGNIVSGAATESVYDDMRKFRNCDSLVSYLSSTEDYSYRYWDTDLPLAPLAVATGDAVKSSEEAAPAEFQGAEMGSLEGVEYSTTNIQVEGVDEADIVKTDGKNIYIVKGSTIRVVRAYPPENMLELDEVTFGETGFYPSEMYVDSSLNRLIVIGTSYDDRLEPYNAKTVYDYSYYGTLTKVYVFDISKASDIELIRQVSFEGNYVSSRKVDETVYLVANKYFYYYGPWREDQAVPLYGDSATGEVMPLMGCSDVYYVPGAVDKSYLIVAGIPVDDAKASISEEVILGASGEVYASRENLYLAEARYNWYPWVTNRNDETIIHKFNLDKSDIAYDGRGAVPGTILNQFSMDEYDSHFRIATTAGDSWSTVNPSMNNVYILDENLKRVGSLEGLAPGESIYSVRFMGEKAYVVTFKKIDPLFVLDLSNHSAPKVLGKLKIPGYSDYLHPFDENHIIGFGKDTVETFGDEDLWADFDFVWYQGMKVAMFDVTDVEHPVELHKIIIGDRGTESPLLWTHKALLFDKEKGLMAFPVSLAEISEDLKDDPSTPSHHYGDYVYQGAYVYDVSVDKGFELRGRVSHYDENEVAEKSGYYWYGDKDIDRILYIGDYLYTVSMGMVKANDMGGLDDVNDVEVGGSSGYGYWYE